MAFHPYPQLIPQVFNPGGFGPPRRLTVASPWPWVDHSASGLHPATTRPIQTRFRYGYPTRVNLATKHNSQAHSSKGTPSPQQSRALTDCRRTVSGTISLPSRGTFHHSLTVLSAIGHQEVFSLTRWSWQIHGRFQESTATRGPSPETGCFHLRDSHPLRPAIPHHSANLRLYHSRGACQHTDSDVSQPRARNP